MSGDKIYLYGAGGLGREFLELIRDASGGCTPDIRGFFDDALKPGTVVAGFPVIGGLAAAKALNETSSVIFSMACTKAKTDISAHLSQNPNIRFPNVIHPTAIVKSRIDSVGVVICSNCGVSVDVRLGNFVLLNNNALVGHDTVIGDSASVMPLAAISGNIKIGQGAFIGAGSTILQGLSIGRDATVGMGSVVLHDVRENTTVVGNPAVRKDR